MSAFTRMMYQTATYWARAANDGFGGTAYTSPVTITCRWQNKKELVRNAQGQEVTSSATVYVDRTLAEKGYVALGDQTAQANPLVVDGARQIISTGLSPSLDATEELNVVYL